MPTTDIYIVRIITDTDVETHEVVKLADNLDEFKDILGGPVSKTNAEMLAISSPIAGQQVFNTTWGQIYTFDGDVWLTANLVKCINKDTNALVEGNPVYQDSATDDGVLTTNVANSIAIIGVVKDIYGGGDTDDYVTVAVAGEHNVLFNNGAVVRGNGIVHSGTEGKAKDTGFGKTGTFGITRGSKGSGSSGLVKCWIQPTERY